MIDDRITQNHVDLAFFEEEGRFPHSEQERRDWCDAKNMQAHARIFPQREEPFWLMWTAIGILALVVLAVLIGAFT